MNEAPRIYALIVAAGIGSRAGGNVPKQYARVAGKALLRHSVEAFLRHPSILGVQVVIHPSHETYYREAIAGLQLLPPIAGGAERADSVRAGLEALAPHEPGYVLIHDAARPFLSQQMISTIIEKLTPDIGVVPALAVADTLRRFDGANWEPVPRDKLLRIQTPQAFPFASLKNILEGGLTPPSASGLTAAASGSASPTHDSSNSKFLTDDAATWLAAHKQLVYVEGSEELRKVTTAQDITWAEKQPSQRIAIGQGFDVHELMPAGEKHKMRLGGIDFPHDHKLHGHSDADVLLHAIVDALLGTIAAGDIGQHFNPKDEQWKGADSRQFLTHARDLVRAAGGIIQHIDSTVICEAPKIAPHRDNMREAIAQLLEISVQQVSVKATTTERLGFTGRGEGIAAQAIATVSLPV